MPSRVSQTTSCRTCAFDTPLRYSTSTAKVVSVNHSDGVQRREFGQLGTALKQSRINGFVRNELRYHAHACPEAVSATTVEAAQ